MLIRDFVPIGWEIRLSLAANRGWRNTSMFKTPHFAPSNTDFTPTDFTPKGSLGKITRRNGDPRQMQFALKFLF